MKKITNVQTKIADPETKEQFRYADLIKFMMNTSKTNQFGQATGFTPSEMEARISIIKTCKENKNASELFFEDAEYATIIECLGTHRWPGIHEDFIDFNKNVKNAETAKVNKNGKDIPNS